MNTTQKGGIWVLMNSINDGEVRSRSGGTVLMKEEVGSVCG